ncbi:hypothetical protein HanXRQr2_Chr13g0580581 [Helianthus annuus]|uniref:Uncharacterized protein n=1 Tax=Helianthus annuus TaxID=4232 RepID=A0A9K3EF51_HELAN|nr:hypothetical protein HanXRQr2_Chr13g0580581 [Helianthus annuus]
MEHLVYIVGVNGVNEIRRTVALLNIILCGMNIWCRRRARSFSLGLASFSNGSYACMYKIF